MNSFTESIVLHVNIKQIRQIISYDYATIEEVKLTCSIYSALAVGTEKNGVPWPRTTAC